MHSRPAFSLIELTIVVAALAILAALVLPRFAGAQDDASEAAAQTNLALIERQVQIYYQTHGVYPDDLDRNWFVGGELPTNPLADFDTTTRVEVFTGDPEQTEPSEKIIADLMTSSWWYSPQTGQVRARVPFQGSPGRTLLLYNRVNGVDAAALSSIIANRAASDGLPFSNINPMRTAR
ncbi:MAG: prepilin-type N-terminal cleavage/methylation domain-containing protein [Planctomycetota bacterium]